MRRVLSLLLVTAATGAGVFVSVREGWLPDPTKLLLAPTSPPVAPSAYPSEPIPRIGTAEHHAVIRALDVDRAGQILVSGSIDKTIKVWRLPSLELLTTIRVPIIESERSGRENAEVGRVNAVALSPDAEFIAAAGTFTRDRKERVYVFDRRSGRLLKALTGPNSTILSLRFSRDSKVLAAGLSNKGRRGVERVPGGVRIWETSGWSGLASDVSCNGDVTSLSFGSGNRLASVCSDGTIRTYDGAFKQTSLAEAPSSLRPFAVEYSPVSDDFVVAFGGPEGGASVALFGASGARRWLSSFDDLFGAFYAVEWSPDASSVFAAGSFGTNHGKVVRKIDAASGATTADFSELANNNTIMGLRRAGTDTLAVVTQDPMIGLYSYDGKVKQKRLSPIIDMRATVESIDVFKVSNDATIVEIQGADKRTFRFDVASYELRLDPTDQIGLSPPRQSADGTTIELGGAENPIATDAAGARHELRMDDGERARSFAISPNGNAIAVGGDWTLRLFSKTGAKLWSFDQVAPDVAWRVTFTPDGRYVVAAYGDGTIRWHRVNDGKELLALLIQPNTRRWAMWSPTGYYEAASEGDALIGWHINQGNDREALFYEAGLFQELYLRPGLGKEVLAAQTAPRAPGADQLRNVLPPIVRILDIVPNSEGTTDLRYVIEARNDQPAEDLRITADGHWIEPLGDPGLSAGKVHLVKVRLAQDVQVVTMTAASRDMIGGTVARGIGVVAAAPPAGTNGRLLALVLGVNNYRHVRKLAYAVHDAEAMAKALNAQDAFYKGGVTVRHLPETSGVGDVNAALEWLATSRREDTSVVFLAGHGAMVGREFYFLPIGARETQLAETAVSGALLVQRIRGIRSRVLVFIDACRSGGLFFNNAVAANALRSPQVAIFAASSDTNPSYESSVLKHGYFTHAILSLVGSGSAATSSAGGQPITVLVLGSQVHDNVKSRTSRDGRSPIQEPDTVTGTIPWGSSIFVRVPANW